MGVTPTIVEQVVQHRGFGVEGSVRDGHCRLDSPQDRVGDISSTRGWGGIVVPGLSGCLSTGC
jgi:hypothetical protein